MLRDLQMPGNVDATSIVAIFAVLLGTLAATAQDWPVKTVKIIVPFAPGATPDLVARLIAGYLHERLGRHSSSRTSRARTAIPVPATSPGRSRTVRRWA